VEAIPDDPTREQLVTLRVDGTIGDVLAVLSREGLAVVVAGGAESQSIRMDVRDVPIDHVLQQLAAALGERAQVWQRAGFVYVGEPRDTDLQVATFYVPSGEANDWLPLYRLSASSSAEVQALDDLIVIRDRSDGLDRAERFHQSASGGRRQYVVEVVFGQLTRTQADRLGISLDLSGVLTSTLALGDAFGATSLEATIRGLIDGAAAESELWSTQTARLHMVEGQQKSVQSQRRVPYRVRSVTEGGAVVDSGVETIDVGLEVPIRLTATSDNRVRIDLEPELSVIDDIIDGLPIVSSRGFEASAIVGEGSVLVVGGIDTMDARDGRDVLPWYRKQTGYDQTRSEGRFYVFVRILAVTTDREPATDQGDWVERLRQAAEAP